MKIQKIKLMDFGEAFVKARAAFAGYDWRVYLKVVFVWLPLTLLVLHLFGFDIFAGYKKGVLVAGMLIRKKHLHWLFVAPEHQKKGIGRRMFAKAKEIIGKKINYHPLPEVKGFYKKVDA